MPRLNSTMRAARNAVLLTLAGALTACGRDTLAPRVERLPAVPLAATGTLPTDNIVLHWDAVLLDALRAGRLGPPMTARVLAIVHTAMYDAWAAYDGHAVGTRYGASLRRPVAERTTSNIMLAVSYAAYDALVDLFPAQKTRFDTEMQALSYDPADRSGDVATPAGVGHAAAAALLEFRHHDGSNQLGDVHAGAYSDYTGYVAVNDPDHINDPNRWQPLRVSDGNGGFVVQKFVAPFWRNVIPFALASASQFRPRVLPNVFPFGGYQKEVEQMIKLSAGLTDREKMIAEYWADGPSSELPPGHWMLFGQFVSRRDGHSAGDDAKMFFALANAMLDASIVAWDAKREFDSVRPVTAIHFWKAGKMIRCWGGPGRGTVVMRGEDWKPYQPSTVVTPSFPEFISGHSTFSAAGAEVLRSMSGSDVFGASVTILAGSSKVEPGMVPASNVTLSWPTFTDAANEAGISRRYGGIHFEQGDLQAREIGRDVGAQAWARAQLY
ncbi:MAG: phosphoesterase, partial [Gemmatimonadota bacterium]|nr:phosphoesterase [Gemmatimonadota bacterium]